MTLFEPLGGLGLFLLGMIIMTEGLRALAGDAIRAALMRFTRSPLSGAATGAVGTAILQSSSATTVAAVGFVSAGLLQFPEALGIIIGANIGTTLKGWLVALFGFKFKLGLLALPLVFAGAVMRLFAKGRMRHAGYALAGFGLLFVGISMMQDGMGGLKEIISFEALPADTLFGRIQLVFLGLLFTLITQSSSAGVAMALTALYSGFIGFEQAAALVIGMDVGTTVTAAMATVGGSVEARRTGYSHVIYNVFTGVMALFLVTPFMMAWDGLVPGGVMGNAEIALVAFHTTFNVLGVILVLPFTRNFAHLMQRVVADRSPRYIQKLDASLLNEPAFALNAVQSAIYIELKVLFSHIDAILGVGKTDRRCDLRELQFELDKTYAYIDRIHLEEGQGADWDRLRDMIHTLDHMQRLHERCEEDEDRAMTVKERGDLSQYSAMLTDTMAAVAEDMNAHRWHEAAKRSKETAKRIHEYVNPYRDTVTDRIARGELDVAEGTGALGAIRWMERVSWHIARITRHYGRAVLASGK